MSDLILALDFGGTKLTAVTLAKTHLTTPHPTWQAYKRTFSPAQADAQSDINTMMQMGHDLLMGTTPAAIGVSFGGPVDFQTGTVQLSHHVPGWENIPLQTLLEMEYHAPVSVDNDANTAAWGEYHFGAGQGVAHMMYITISTGIGGGLVLNGRLWRGHNSMAGEIGHMVVDPQGPQCLCGKQGCVERLASGPYMAQDLASQLDTPDPSPIITGKKVAELAAAGHQTAQAILQRGAQALGLGIGNTANLLNLQRFVLGGGVTKSGDAWWQTVQHTARQTALPEVKFDIVPAALGDDAPLWGAIALSMLQSSN